MNSTSDRTLVATERELDSRLLEGASTLRPETAANARALFLAVRGIASPPAILVGYHRDSLIFEWEWNPPVQVEIFEERFESYRMFDGRTDIRHYAQEAGSLPAALLRFLSEAGPR
jgi:hypothetical protein